MCVWVSTQSIPQTKQKCEWDKIDHLIPQTKHPLKPQLKRPENYDYTFSDTLLLLPLSNSGAIHGRVPLTPPETRVFLLILDKPKSPTCIEIIIHHMSIMQRKTIQLHNSTIDGSYAHFTYGTWLIFKIYKQVITLQIKVHNIFRVQIFQAKCSIHCYDKTLTTIEISVQ